jgi:hypothetical protein
MLGRGDSIQDGAPGHGRRCSVGLHVRQLRAVVLRVLSAPADVHNDGCLPDSPLLAPNWN